MSANHRVLMAVLMAGFVTAGITNGSWMLLGPIVGSITTLVAIPLIGACCTMAARSAALGRAARDLAALNTPGNDGNPLESPLIGSGHPGFDREWARLRECLDRSRRILEEYTRAERIARGFLGSNNDRVSSSLKGMEEGAIPAARLTMMLDRLRDAALAIHRDASSLEEQNEGVATGATDQATAVSQTTSAMEALSEKIDRISLNANEAAQSCKLAQSEASQGLDQVLSSIEGMDRLVAQVEANCRKARRLEDRSKEIGAIVATIGDISGRTDILALNATIESVRAGEHGRGFAVIAEEIRKLAERAAAATREIGTIVEAIQADTRESIRAMVEGQAEMQQESLCIRETGSALERISQVSERSARLVEGISRSTNDQVRATQELVRAMQRISEVAHQTLQLTTQARSTIRTLAASCGPWQSSDSQVEISSRRGSFVGATHPADPVTA